MIDLFSTGVIKRPLGSAWRALLLAVVGLAGLALVPTSLRIGAASRLGDSGNITDLRRALAIDPADPELHRRLGIYDTFLADPPNTSEGLAHLRRATELAPLNAMYWANLGSACESTGDTACAQAAFDRLLVLNPMMPRYRWAVANFDLRTDRADEAMAQFRRLLEAGAARSYAERTFDICLRATGDAPAVFQSVLAGGKDPELKLDFVRYLSDHDQLDAAHQIWVKTVASSPPFAFSEASDYLAHLLSLGRYEDALGVWHDLERLGAVERLPGRDPDNLVYNGGFEAQPINAGFDWHSAELPFLSFSFADPGAYQGSRCLRLDFSVKRNELYQPIYQFVAVEPGRAYRLEAYVRSENITSDTGPELRVFDPLHPENLDTSTETTIGTTRWHPVSVNFRPGPGTHFVMLAIRRERSRNFPTEISGTFWVDAISLKAVSSSAEAKAAKS